MDTTLKYFIVSQVIVIIGMLISAWMVRSQLVGIRKDHEARRREKSIEILFKFAELSNNGLLFVPRKLIASLNPSEKKAIIDANNDIFLNKDNLPYIKSILCRQYKNCNQNCDSCHVVGDSADKIKIKREDVILLRQAIITYLNIIEFIALAAIKNIADKDIIAEQFQYLIKDKEKYISTLKECNINEDFPCIKAFFNEFNQDKTNKQPEKL